MKIDPHAYNITIRKAAFDGETLFEARVKELPDLVEYGESFDEAYDLAVDAIDTAATAFVEKGRMFPSAIVPADDYSGRVTLRMPRSLHRALAESSDEEGVSLNQHLVNILCYFSGFSAGKKIPSASHWHTVKEGQEKTNGPRPNLRLVHSDTLQEKQLEWG